MSCVEDARKRTQVLLADAEAERLLGAARRLAPGGPDAHGAGRRSSARSPPTHVLQQLHVPPNRWLSILEYKLHPRGMQGNIELRILRNAAEEREL